MFPPFIRIILIALSIMAAVVSVAQGKESWPLFMVAAILLIVGHFRGGSIWIAFQAYRRQNFQNVRKYIAATKNPEWLRPSSRSYYYFLCGVISTIDKDYKKAKELFLLAVNGELRTEHLKSVTYCILADTSLRLNEIEEARSFFEKAKKISHRDEIKPMLDDLTQRINEKA